MKHFLQTVSWFLLWSLGLIATGYAQSNNGIVKDKTLGTHWKIQTSEKLKQGGQQLSKPTYHPHNWLDASVPTTVLAAMIKNGKFKDIYASQKLSEIAHYKNIYFSNNLSKISSYKFNVPWWYRSTFNLQAKDRDKTFRLVFNGINYRADIWLNGHKVASSDTLAGSFRRFTIDITPYVRSGSNAVALKITRPRPGNASLGFVDWNPEPPDHNMGLWRSVHLLISGPVSIDQPFVKTKIDTTDLQHAKLTVSTMVQNHSSQVIRGTLKGSIKNHGSHVQFSKPVALTSGEQKEVVFNPEEFKQLHIDHPKLWWTHTLGEPNLYALHLRFITDKKTSDKKTKQFGIRTVSSYINKDGFRGFKLNGRKILIKGGGWTDPMLLNASKSYEKAGIDYAVHMHLNALRMEGFWGKNQHLYNLADKKGILIQVGYSAQWEWSSYFGAPVDKYGGIKTQTQMHTAAQSFKDQVIWLRNHPSIFLWTYGSDKMPRPALEERYLSILKKYDPTRPAVSSAKEHTSTISGPSAVKMRGPYDYVPPNYWYIDSQNGGAFGFNTETGPGPEIPVLESLKKMIPADSLWPISDAWLYHAARGYFHNLEAYNQAMSRRLGKARNLNDYLRKAQYLNYEGMRAMYEAFEVNKPKATGIIQWMYNASWPKLWWQLYDFYLRPTGAFYGARKANQPIHISYNYGNNAIDVMNNTSSKTTPMKAQIRVLNFNMQTMLDKHIQLPSYPGRKAESIFSLPDSMHLSKTYFLDLKLRNQAGHVISNNFYALSTQKDKIDPSKATWNITPQSQFADLQKLDNLPSVKLDVQQHISQQGDSTFAHIVVKNPSPHLAFKVHLDLNKGSSGSSVVPIFWDDNYFSLLPGEKRTINGYCHTKDLDGQQPTVTIGGWNIKNNSKNESRDDQ